MTDATPSIDPRILAACDIAAGRTPADEAAEGARVTGARKDLNAKGNGAHWYRMVWRGGEWVYVSPDRLPAGTFLASDRRAVVYGVVYPGEITIDHDYGAPVDAAGLAHEEVDGEPLSVIEFTRRRGGKLAFTLVDGSVVVLPDPRAK